MSDVNQLLAVIDKLDEAAFFCGRVRDEPDAFKVGHYVNAFAGACYGWWECLELLCRGATRLETCPRCGKPAKVPVSESDAAWQWFRQARKTAKGSPVAKYFHQGRDADVHEGTPFVDAWTIALVDADGELESRTSAHLRESRTGGFPDKQRPGEACDDYLSSLVRISCDGYRKFGRTWDAAHELEKDVQRLERKWAAAPQ